MILSLFLSPTLGLLEERVLPLARSLTISLSIIFIDPPVTSVEYAATFRFSALLIPINTGWTLSDIINWPVLETLPPKQLGSTESLVVGAAKICDVQILRPY